MPRLRPVAVRVSGSCTPSPSGRRTRAPSSTSDGPGTPSSGRVRPSRIYRVQPRQGPVRHQGCTPGPPARARSRGGPKSPDVDPYPLPILTAGVLDFVRADSAGRLQAGVGDGLVPRQARSSRQSGKPFSSRRCVREMVLGPGRRGCGARKGKGRTSAKTGRVPVTSCSTLP